MKELTGQMSGDFIEMLPLSEGAKKKVVNFIGLEVPQYCAFLDKFKKEIIGNVYSDKKQKEINQATFGIVAKGDELESIINNKQIIGEIKKMFRKLIAPWILESLILKRALEKPRGYPGDYMMLEYVYDNKPVSQGLGHYFDQGFLDSQLTKTVRSRKETMRSILENEINDVARGISILNLASGSCREIAELDTAKIVDKPDFVCVDFDEEALKYSKSKTKDKDISFIKDDIIEIARKGRGELFKDKDLIYSIGLVDYFPDRLLKRLLLLILSNMKSDGKLILTFKDRDRYKPIQEDWLTDWTFVPRNQMSIEELFRDLELPGISVAYSREPSGIIIFTMITKQ